MKPNYSNIQPQHEAAIQVAIANARPQTLVEWDGRAETFFEFNLPPGAASTVTNINAAIAAQAPQPTCTLDGMVASKLANGEYASGSTDQAKNERDVIVDILTSTAVRDVTIHELNGLMIHPSRSVRNIAQMASAERRGIRLGQDGKMILDYPVTDLERELMAIMPCDR